MTQAYLESREVPLPLEYRDGMDYRDPRETWDVPDQKENRESLVYRGVYRDDGRSAFGTISMTKLTTAKFW